MSAEIEHALRKAARVSGKSLHQTMSTYCDHDGNPMTMEEWARKFEDQSYRQIEDTTIGDVRISTVWLGLDHGLGASGHDPKPIIFETMVFGGYFDGQAVRYETEAQAVCGHNNLCIRITQDFKDEQEFERIEEMEVQRVIAKIRKKYETHQHP